MKRTATTMILLAGFGGGCVSPDAAKKDPVGGFGTVTRGKQVPGVMGPNGEPVMAAAATARGAPPGGVVQAGGSAGSGGIQQVALFKGFSSAGADCPSCAHVPGVSGNWGSAFAANAGGRGPGCADGNCGTPGYGPGYGAGYGPYAGGGYGGAPPGFGAGGIFPVPSQGAPGAVAAVGALGIGGGGGPAIANGRTSIKFTGPAGMKITWQLPGGVFNDEASGLTAPKEYNFLQSQTYRLRLTQVLPNHPGKSFYPTLEVSPGNPKSLTFLAHSSVPLTFTNDDFDQAAAGNLVVKVVYLPDRENQDFATVAGAEELVSTRLEPGADPVAEAQRRGTILAVIRLGNIDLENRISPAMSAPPGGGMMMQPRGGPIMLPGPPSTMPGPITMPMTPVKPPMPLLSPVPPGKQAGTGGGAGAITLPTSPTVPAVPRPLPAGPNSLGSDVPAVLPPIVPGGPGTGSGLPVPVPPIK